MKNMSDQFPKVDKILMRQINEKANGGFIMFTFGEDGYPVVSSHFDDASKAMALQHCQGNLFRPLVNLGMHRVHLETQKLSIQIIQGDLLLIMS